MSRNWWMKFGLLFFFTALSVVYVTPTVMNLNLEKTRFPFKKKINLGLDLQGGLYMVLGVDFDKVFSEVVQRQVSSVEAGMKDKSIVLKSVKFVSDGLPKDDKQVVIEFDPANRDKVYENLKKYFWNLALKDEKPGQIGLGLTREYKNEIREKTINQSIEVIRNRIDEFGVSEPSITSQGADRVVVELPGVKDVQRAKDLIGRTAKLQFRIVNDKGMNPAQVSQVVTDVEKALNFTYKDGDKFSDYVAKINEGAKGKIPEDSEILFDRTKTFPGSKEEIRRPYLIFKKVDVTGDDLADAFVSFDQETRAPEVAFKMNPRGATLFGKLTEDNIGKGLAIVLDNIVHSAPRINSRIADSGRITLGAGDPEEKMREAKDLSIVLRAGALPAQLEFLEQRVVGPSLGQDSIHKGAMASLLGSLAVFLFVLFYYRVSGVIAVFSLLLNVLFVLACLVGLEATLTLPGIAGIALTVGIAVDSNVVVYERIREELRSGKRVLAAVEAGFDKALHTIMDANVTNAAAAVVLLLYGTGPIKGFAVTLLIGIVTTLFTAVFVCRLVFDWYLHRLDVASDGEIAGLSI